MITMFLPFGVITSLFIGYWLYRRLFPPLKIDPNGKYVLISGCDTGFGHSLAVKLDRLGFNVLAGVYNARTESTLAEELSDRALVFRLDITKAEDIDRAFDLVKSRTSNLYALINNAGVGDSGLIDWISVESIRQVMEVNFFGQVAMTKRFLPLLLVQRHSRVISMSSAAGFLAAAGASAYSASKYALEAFSDCLRREMSVWNLHVSIIEPGFMRTPIIDAVSDKMRSVWFDRMDDETKERWGETFFQQWLENGRKLVAETADDPEKVIGAVTEAVIRVQPRTRYRPGWQSSLFCFPLSIVPTWFVDGLIRFGERNMVLPNGVRTQR